MNELEAKGKEENDRQYRVVDQLLSMHSSLRDCLERRAFWLNTSLIAASLFLTVFAFVGDALLGKFGVEPDKARFVFGVTAVVILIVSITEFRVDWRSVAGRHGEAAGRLAQLKSKYRGAYVAASGSDPATNLSLTTQYNEVMGSLPPIPDRWFSKLKARHRFKRILSERVSAYPKAPIWFLRFRIRIEGLAEAAKGRASDDA